jgi:hypothetical protein
MLVIYSLGVTQVSAADAHPDGGSRSLLHAYYSLLCAYHIFSLLYWYAYYIDSWVLHRSAPQTRIQMVALGSYYMLITSLIYTE